MFKYFKYYESLLWFLSSLAYLACPKFIKWSQNTFQVISKISAPGVISCLQITYKNFSISYLLLLRTSDKMSWFRHFTITTFDFFDIFKCPRFLTFPKLSMISHAQLWLLLFFQISLFIYAILCPDWSRTKIKVNKQTNLEKQ